MVGNSLGLQPSDGALINFAIIVLWDFAADDETVESTAIRYNNEIDTLAKERGLFHRFVYMNYAHTSQDPIAGYGEEVKSKLQTVSKKYDSQGIFQKAVPGGFKLF